MWCSVLLNNEFLFHVLQVDISSAVAYVMSVREEHELTHVKVISDILM